MIAKPCHSAPFAATRAVPTSSAKRNLAVRLRFRRPSGLDWARRCWWHRSGSCLCAGLRGFRGLVRSHHRISLMAILPALSAQEAHDLFASELPVRPGKALMQVSPEDWRRTRSLVILGSARVAPLLAPPSMNCQVPPLLSLPPLMLHCVRFVALRYEGIGARLLSRRDTNERCEVRLRVSTIAGFPARHR